jgi:formiminotetrahydrofolate cyclodeaminase
LDWEREDIEAERKEIEEQQARERREQEERDKLLQQQLKQATESPSQNAKVWAAIFASAETVY